MNAEEVIVSLEERLQVLEITTNGSGDLELSKVFSKLSGELRKLFYEGREYSSRLIRFLENFEGYEPCEDINVKQEAIVSCYRGLMKSLEELTLLDASLEELSKIDIRRLQPCEIVNLREFPKLVDKCNSLLVGSILLAKRFMEMNIRFNEFWLSVNTRLSKLDGNEM